MSPPPFWRRASFSVDETADIIGVSRDCMRGWLARLPFNDFAGLKRDGRIWLSGQDAFYFLLVSVLTMWGVPVRVAFQEAGAIVDEMDDGPQFGKLVVTSREGERHFEPWVFEEYGPTPTLIIPIRDLYEGHLERCGKIGGARRVAVH